MNVENLLKKKSVLTEVGSGGDPPMLKLVGWIGRTEKMKSRMIEFSLLIFSNIPPNWLVYFPFIDVGMITT